MRVSKHHRSAVVATMLVGFPALGQGEVTWWWEGSTDNGATWQRNLFEIPSEQRAVRVRARCQFPTELPGPTGLTYFGSVEYDGTVTSSLGVGMGDTADSILFATRVQRNAIAVTRHENVLKFDDATDTSPPGLGNRWAWIYQPAPHLLPVPNFDNPISPIEFTLRLDGTLGDRAASAIFRRYTDLPLDRRVSIYSQFGTFQNYSATVEPLTIRVIPAPGASAIAGLGLLALARRARRASE